MNLKVLIYLNNSLKNLESEKAEDPRSISLKGNICPGQDWEGSCWNACKQNLTAWCRRNPGIRSMMLVSAPAAPCHQTDTPAGCFTPVASKVTPRHLPELLFLLLLLNVFWSRGWRRGSDLAMLSSCRHYPQTLQFIFSYRKIYIWDPVDFQSPLKSRRVCVCRLPKQSEGRVWPRPGLQSGAACRGQAVSGW